MVEQLIKRLVQPALLPGEHASDWDFLATQRAEGLPATLGALPGDILGTLGHALALPARGAKSILGHTLAIPQAFHPLTPPEDREKLKQMILGGATGEEKFHQILAPSPVGGLLEFGVDVAADPTSWLGGPASPAMKVVGFGAKHLDAIANPGVRQGVARTLNMLENVNGAYDAGQAAVLAKGKAGAAGALGKIPAPPKAIITDEFGNRTPAASLGELMGARTRETWARLESKKNADLIKILDDSGHRLGMDLSITSGVAPIKWPGSTEKATEQLDAAMRGLRANVAGEQNPIIKLAGIALWNRADQLQRSAWDQAFLRRQNLMEHYGVDVSDLETAKEFGIMHPYHQVTNAMRDAHGQGMRAIQAADIGLEKLRRRIQTEPEPWQGTYYTEVADKTLAAIGDTIDQFGAQIKAAPSWGRPGIIEARNAKLDEISQQAMKALGTAGADVLTTGAGKQIAQILDQIHNVSGGRAMIEADLPARFTDRRFAADVFDKVEALAPKIVADQQVVRRALEEMWTRTYQRTGAPPPPRQPLDWRFLNMDEAGQRLETANELLQGIGLPPAANSVELIDRMNRVLPDGAPILSDKMRRQATEAIGRWPDADLLLADPYELVLGRLTRQTFRDRFGIEDPGKAQQAVNDLTALWKEGQVFTPTYWLSDLLGNLPMSALEGVNPMKILGPLRQNTLDALHGKEVHNPSATRLSETLGTPIPTGTGSGSSYLHEINPTREYFRKGITASEKVGPFKLSTGLGLLGAAAGAAGDEEDRAQGAAVGAALGVGGGLGWAKLAPKFFAAVGALETTAREEAWTTGTVAAAQKLAPELLTKVQELLDQTWQGVRATGTVPTGVYPTGAPGARILGVDTSRETVTRGVPEAAKQAAMDELRTVLASQEGLINTNQLQEILIRNGVDITKAREVGSWWANAADEASQEGLKLSNKINFDYQDKNTVEELVSTVSPFATWALKAYPFFLEHLMARPGLAVALRELNQMSAGQQEEGGLTPRFTGSIEQGLGSRFMSAILGHGVGAFYNPTRAFLPFSDLQRGLKQTEGEENLWQKGLGVAGALGFSAHPLIETGLRVANQLGPDEAPRGLLRYGEPIKALTAMAGLNKGQGIDFNLPFTGAERAIRTKLTGQEPTDLGRANVLKRLDELALRETGLTTSQKAAAVAPYIKAKAEQRGELWDRAAREVQQERGLSALAGYVYQGAAPQALLTDEERAIRLARKEAPEGGPAAGRVVYDPKLLNELRDLVSEGKQRQPAPPKLLEEAAHDVQQLYGTQVPPLLMQRLERGTVADVDAIRRAVASAQIQASPLQAAYSGFGTPEEQRLSNLLSQYQSPSALLMTDPELAGVPAQQLEGANQLWQIYQGLPPALAQNISGGNMPSAMLLKRMMERQRTYKEANPELAGYLAYQAEKRGTGTMEDYFKTRQR